MGADVSHRGGNPGFVTVAAPDVLAWPENAGKKVYMTLGNLELDARAGLLFIDWDTGAALHVTGRAHTNWATEAPTVNFDIEHIVAVEHSTSLRWTFGGSSKFNPA